MSNEILNKILDDEYDIEKEDSLRTMISDFYTKKRISTILIVWVYGVLMIALSIWSAVEFFRTETTKELIMFATLFLLGFQQISIIKIFAWQVIHRTSIKRDIKKVELMLTQSQATNQSLE